MSTDLWESLGHQQSEPQYRFGTQRAVPPAETLRRIRPLLEQAGITRLADVTGLDWLGIHVYQAVRPNSRNISVSQGKGLTRVQAKVSALMESLESFHAEEIRHPGKRESIRELRAELRYDPYDLAVACPAVRSLPRDPGYEPYAIPIGKPTILRDDIPLDWVGATDLSTGEPTWVPRQLCELNYCLDERLAPPLFRASTNGLASGNTVAEALVHGLCEVIERDSLHRLAQDGDNSERSVPPESVTSRLAVGLLDRFAQNGLVSRISDATGPTGLPCFQVVIAAEASRFGHIGAGCHPNRTTALVRALTEAAQSRAAHIAGSRDDVLRRTYPAPFEPTSTMASPAARETTDFAHIGTVRRTPWRDQVQDIVARIEAATGTSPMAVDLTRPDFAIPVVFVVAPGLRLVAPSRR